MTTTNYQNIKVRKHYDVVFPIVNTIILILLTTVLAVDFGKMRKYELEARASELVRESQQEEAHGKGKVFDLILPVVSLIVLSIVSMLYTGGFFDGGMSIGDAFANCDAIVGLAMGAFYTVIVVALLYLPRRIVTPKVFMDGLVQGFINMVPATLILVFAWTLKNMTDSLGAREYVAALVKGSARGFQSFLPFIIFLIAVGLSFSTGTSWGTFGILIPIVISCFKATDPSLMIISISACMAGAVCGDHCSPISDTTIMSSAGAQCNHLNHVSTQLPYALTCAAVSAVTYIVAGFTKSAWISLPVGIVLLFAVLFVLKKRQGEAAVQ